MGIRIHLVRCGISAEPQGWAAAWVWGMTVSLGLCGGRAGMRTGSASHIMWPQAHLITSDPRLAHSSEELITPALPRSGFGR